MVRDFILRTLLASSLALVGGLADLVVGRFPPLGAVLLNLTGLVTLFLWIVLMVKGFPRCTFQAAAGGKSPRALLAERLEFWRTSEPFANE